MKFEPKLWLFYGQQIYRKRKIYVIQTELPKTEVMQSRNYEKRIDRNGMRLRSFVNKRFHAVNANVSTLVYSRCLE